MVEDAGDVGGEEVFAVADADDGGWAHAGGDELVGLVRGEDADGEGSGEAVDGAADCFFERRGRRRFRSVGAFVECECGVETFCALRSSSSIRWAMISVSVSVTKVWPAAVSSCFEGEVVFDDAVVDDDEGAGAVAVGVGVLFGGAAVGGPAGVADAEGAVDGVVGDDGFEVAELAGGSAELRGRSGPPATAMPAES